GGGGKAAVETAVESAEKKCESLARLLLGEQQIGGVHCGFTHAGKNHGQIEPSPVCGDDLGRVSRGGLRGGQFFSRGAAKARICRGDRPVAPLLAACLAAARQVTLPIRRREGSVGARHAVRFFFLTRRREGAKKAGKRRHVLPLRGNSRCRYEAAKVPWAHGTPCGLVSR
ncbi:MAG: hypothetical protein GX617_00235, partial [Lentisphaerae bacterium]|nr:hypothetical protein [Lentisphaerota bacterium]